MDFLLRIYALIWLAYNGYFCIKRFKERPDALEEKGGFDEEGYYHDSRAEKFANNVDTILMLLSPSALRNILIVLLLIFYCFDFGGMALVHSYVPLNSKHSIVFFAVLLLMIADTAKELIRTEKLLSMIASSDTPKEALIKYFSATEKHFSWLNLASLAGKVIVSLYFFLFMFF